MEDFEFCVPTKLRFGRDIFEKYAAAFSDYGNRALIVTGKISAKESGALDAVRGALDKCGITHVLFNRVSENPVATMIEECASFGIAEGVEFVIGIGGGSAMDTAKMSAILIQHPEYNCNMLTSKFCDNHLPIICVPTTAGTGSEMTPFVVVSFPENNEKKNMNVKAVPTAAWVNPAFTASVPIHVRRDTALDALCQLVESILTTRSQPIVSMLSLNALRLLKPCLFALREEKIDDGSQDLLMLLATLSGLAISMTGISLPHVLSYPLTSNMHISHGRACALLLTAYVGYCPKEDAAPVLRALGIDDTIALGELLRPLLGKRPLLSDAQIETFSTEIMNLPVARLSSFHGTLDKTIVENIYRSVLSDV